MMNTKEKLVELLMQVEDNMCDDCGREPVGCAVVAIADHLIANGVTVQECGHWVSLTGCANAGVYCSACNKKVYKEDYAWCNRKNKLRSNYCPHCGAKMDFEG